MSVSRFAGAAMRGIVRNLSPGQSPGRSGLEEFPPLDREDRLLVLSPHEDDESLGTGGLIQQAVARGIPVQVVYLTNGDHNELAFMIYRRRPWIDPKINREMGDVRRCEAEEAMAFLGVSADRLFFLGFPDNGTLAIWDKHWGAAPPLHSLLTDSRKVPYRHALCCGSPYKGEVILKALERRLLDFRPTRVFVPHPLDGNPDHRAYYLFLRLALLDLDERLSPPRVFTYPVHMGPWPRPHWYRPGDWLPYPARLAGEEADSFITELTPEQVERKYRAITFYRSQMSDCDYWLTAFARRNELFIEVSPPTVAIGDCWGRLLPAVASASTADYGKKSRRGHLDGVAYRSSAAGLGVKVDLLRRLERRLGLSLHAFGWRRDTPFGSMPKVHLVWSMEILRAHDRGDEIDTGGVTIEKQGTGVLFTIPWEMLGGPEALFLQVRGIAGGISRSYTRWELLAPA